MAMTVFTAPQSGDLPIQFDCYDREAGVLLRGFGLVAETDCLSVPYKEYRPRPAVVQSLVHHDWHFQRQIRLVVLTRCFGQVA